MKSQDRGDIMNHELLKQVIYDQHRVIQNEEIFDREYEFEKNANYVLVGLRRAGKSTILYKIVQELVFQGIEWDQIIYINFEDERLAEFKMEDFNDILLVHHEMTDKKAYYFFDEIQNIDGWEKFARRLADSKEFVYITGSNAKMLSSEIESALGGRYFSKKIYPYNFREYCIASKVEYNQKAILSTETNGKIQKCLGEYFRFGGFPETINFSLKREYVENIYQKILLGDIAKRYDIRNFNALRLLIKKLAESIRTGISYSKLSSILKNIGISISKDTVVEYLSYAQDAFLIFSIQNYVGKFAEKEINPKYYFTDNGLLNLFLFNKDSILLENIVAISLYKKYKNNLCYLKSSKTGIDVDFYIDERSLAIQVIYELSQESRDREINNLLKLSKAYGVEELMIITYRDEDIIEQDGKTIKVVPLYKFLLNE